MLDRITDPYGRQTTLAYSGGLLVSITDFAGRVTEVNHNAQGQITSIVSPDPDGGGALAAPVNDYAYDAATGLLTGTTDGRGQSTSYAYDPYSRRLQTVTLPGGGTRFVDASQDRDLIDPATTSPMFPGNLPDTGRKTTITVDEVGGGTEAAINRFGQPKSVTDALGKVTTFYRSPDGLLLGMVEPDPDGTGPLGPLTTWYQYDGLRNVTRIDFPDGSNRQWTYDGFSQVTSFTDELGRVTLYTLDLNTGDRLKTTQIVGQLDSVLNGQTDDVVSHASYTPKPANPGDLPGGLLLTETDPLGRVTEYVYYNNPSEPHRFGRVQTMTVAAGTPDEAVQAFEYDAAGRLSAEIDPLGRRTEYAYDNLDRLIATTLPDPDGAGPAAAPVLSYAYDAVGHVLSEIDPLGNVTAHSYDALGRVTSQADALGNLTQYEYDALGRQTLVTLPESTT